MLEPFPGSIAPMLFSRLTAISLIVGMAIWHWHDAIYMGAIFLILGGIVFRQAFLKR